MGGEGLRERKKRTTHETIQRAALTLFARDGYAATTVADVARAADVSPRTVALHFPTKEDLLFPADAVYEDLSARLEHRGPDESALDALRACIAELLDAPLSEVERRERWRLAQTRRAIIDADPALRARERGHLDGFERLLAGALARDLGCEPDAITPQIAAAAAVAMFIVLRRTPSVDRDRPLTAEEGLAVVDHVLSFLRGGLAAVEVEDT